MVGLRLQRPSRHEKDRRKIRSLRLKLHVAIASIISIVLLYAKYQPDTLDSLYYSEELSLLGITEPWPPKSMIDPLVDEQSGIVVLIVNCGYADMGDNLIQSMFNISFTNFVLVPLDELSFQIFSALYPKHTLPLPPSVVHRFTNGTLATKGGKQEQQHATHSSLAESSSFGSKQFVAITSSRASIIKHFLLLGYTVFYCDLDTVWRSNALKFFHGLSTHGIQEQQNRQFTVSSFQEYNLTAATIENQQMYGNDTRIRNSKSITWNNNPSTSKFKYELLVFRDAGSVLCSGFIYARPTVSVLRVLNTWDWYLQRALVMDQRAFNVVVKRLAPSVTHAVVPHEGGIPNGRKYFDQWLPGSKTDSNLERLVNQTRIIHNNFVVGHASKSQRFKDHGLWKLSPEFQMMDFNCTTNQILIAK